MTNFVNSPGLPTSTTYYELSLFNTIIF